MFLKEMQNNPREAQKQMMSDRLQLMGHETGGASGSRPSYLSQVMPIHFHVHLVRCVLFHTSYSGSVGTVGIGNPIGPSSLQSHAHLTGGLNMERMGLHLRLQLQ